MKFCVREDIVKLRSRITRNASYDSYLSFYTRLSVYAYMYIRARVCAHTHTHINYVTVYSRGCVQLARVYARLTDNRDRNSWEPTFYKANCKTIDIFIRIFMVVAQQKLTQSF